MDFSIFYSKEAIIPIVLLASLIMAMLLTLMMKNLVKSAISLSVLSAILSIIMFLMKLPLAAVFELSVCAGLVTVLFISTISITRQKDSEEISQLKKKRKKRFLALPFILVAITIILFFAWPSISKNLILSNVPHINSTVQDVLWYGRQVDILGQIIIILAGVFGIVLLFKEREVK